MLLFLLLFLIDLETNVLEEKNKRDHYTQLVGACLVRTVFGYMIIFSSEDK